MSNILTVKDLVKHYEIGGTGIIDRMFGEKASVVRSVDGVSFSIDEGQTLGLVGESGCGKSTVGRSILRLVEPTKGKIELDGQDISHVSEKVLRPLRKNFVAEPIGNYDLATGDELKEKVQSLFERVGLRADQVDRYPHEFSGGQWQRIGIARALAMNPKLIILDEPVSALDVSVQAQVINLLVDLQKELGVAYLFIAHDLAVVEHISTHVAVMYLGKVVEIADKKSLFDSPKHPYTKALLSAVPNSDPDAISHRIVLKGDIPSPTNPPSGCRFRTRCPIAQEICTNQEPALEIQSPGHETACHFAKDEV